MDGIIGIYAKLPTESVRTFGYISVYLNHVEE
mgnify:CR=1 FL=1